MSLSVFRALSAKEAVSNIFSDQPSGLCQLNAVGCAILIYGHRSAILNPSSYHGYAIHQLWAILYFFIECMLNPFRRTLDACSIPSFTDHSFPRVIGGRLCQIFQNVFLNFQT